MAEMIRPSFEKMAFLGEKSRDARFVSRVDATKDKLNIALNPIDPVAERRMNGNASAVVKGLAESGEWSCESVKSLVETVSDPTRSANRDIAKERLDVLATSTYIVMTHGENEALHQAIGTKDGAVIDAALPESLKGIGGRVAEIATEQEITDPKLKEALKKLDRRADVLRASGSVGEEKLKELIGDKILELSELVDELDDRGYDELTRVSAYLGAEAERIGEDTSRNDGEIGRDQSIDVRIDGIDEAVDAMVAATSSMENLVAELSEKPESRSMEFDEMRAMLDYIEKSGSKSDDISLNSRLKKSLMDVAIGTRRIQNLPDGMSEGDVVKEIRLRLALNDCYLLASATGAKTADGIDRFLSQTRMDDTEHKFDRETISFFLCGGESGANGIPVDLAWDLRQKAYFSYESVLAEAASNSEIIGRHPELATEEGRRRLLDLGDPIMRKNEEYGIYRDYYNNYRCDKDGYRREIVRDYMVQNIMDTRGVTREVAEKSWELAMKLSVATYTDSAANIAFIDGDDLAEVLLFKFIRYQDGVEADGKKSAKNKPVGSIDTIKYINSLLPVPLAYAQRESARRGMYMPIFSADLDPSRIDGKSDLEYVLGPIFHKKAQEVKTAIMTDLTPKEGCNLSFLQKTFERLNKVMSETDRAGWSALNPREFDSELRKKENLMLRQRLFRTWFITGMMERATESPSLGWTRSSLYELERTLFGRTTFIDENSAQGDVFITKEDWDWINKAYRVKSTLKVFEDDERRAKRYLFK